MASTILNIEAQIWENYSDTDTPYWKPKGGQKFAIRFPIDADELFHLHNDTIIEVINEILKDHSNDHVKYSYIEHDVQYYETIQIPEEEFLSKIK